MTAFDFARDDGDPGLSRLRVIHTAGWRQAWHRRGPWLPIVFGVGMILGSWLALLAMEIGR